LEGWQLYRDSRYDYQIHYPPSYVVVERAGGEPSDLLATVEFRDRHLVRAATAHLEPPQFAIEVFDNRARLPARKWLEAAGRLGGQQNVQVESIPLAGVVALRVSSPLLLAPNSFICLGRETSMFILTPLGEYAEEMLDTFRFGR
jgi:hypothetical protein